MGFKKLLILLASALFIQGCLSDLEMPAMDVDITAPIFTTTIEPWDILPDSLLEGDSILSLVYTKTLFEVNPDLFFNATDSLSYTSLKTPYNVTYPPGSKFYDNTVEKVLNTGSAQITRMKVDKGSILVDINSTIKGKLILEYTVPDAQKNGIPLSQSIVIPSAQSGNIHIQSRIDICGYSIDLRGLTGNKFNRVVSRLTGRIHPDGTSTTISSSDSLTILAVFDELNPAEIRGYFGSSSISDTSTTHIQVFELFKKGSISVQDVKAGISIENGLGMDASLYLSKLLAENTLNQQNIALNHQVIGNTILVTRATETPGMAEPLKPTRLHYDLATGNIEEMLEILPNYLTYEYSGNTNPMGNISSGNDFYFKGYPFKAIFNLEVPLRVNLNRLKLAEYTDIDLVRKQTYINNGRFFLKAINTFPFSIQLNLLMCDSNNLTIDTLLYQGSIAQAGFSGTTTIPITSHISITAAQNKILNLYKTKRILIEVFLNTPQGTPNLQLSSGHKLWLGLSGDFNLHVD